MTPLSSIRQNTVRTYYNTSTARAHISNSQWNQHNGTHFPFWTLYSPYNQIIPSAPQFTENPPIQINTYIGTATITSQQNKVSSTPWHIGPTLFLHPRKAWTRNWNTSTQPSNTSNSPPWALNQWHLKFTQSNQQSNHTTNTTNNNNPTDSTKNKATIVVPYIPNTREKFKKQCKRKGIQVHFKGTKHPQNSTRKP